MLKACSCRSDSLLMRRRRLRAFVTSSNHFSILPMTNSPFSIFMANARLPRRSVSPSLCGCWRCTLMKPVQFLVMALSPISSRFEYAIPSGMSICRSLSRQTFLVFCLVMLLKP